MSLVGNRFTLEKIEKAFERLWRSLDDLIPFLKIEFDCAPDQVRVKNPEYYFDPLDIKYLVGDKRLELMEAKIQELDTLILSVITGYRSYRLLVKQLLMI